MYNILRNLYYCTSNNNNKELDDIVFTELNKIEEIYTGSIQKKPNKKYNTMERIINNYKNENIFVCSENYPFICVPSRSSIDKKNEYNKFLIWYTPVKLSKEDIPQVLNNIRNMFTNKNIKPKNDDYDTLDTFDMDIEFIDLIYHNIKAYNKDLFVEEYLYNISSLFGEKDFKQEKYMLDNMIKKSVEYYKKIKNYLIDEHYVVYHYLTTSFTSCLHIHIVTNKLHYDTKSVSIYSVGYENLDTIEYSKYYAINYYHLIYDIWKYNHTYLLFIPCEKNIVEYMKKYIFRYNGNIVTFDEFVYMCVVKDKTELDVEYDIILQFIIKCMQQNIIYNYFYYIMEQLCGKKYISELLKYRNNCKNLLRLLHNILY